MRRRRKERLIVCGRYPAEERRCDGCRATIMRAEASIYLLLHPSVRSRILLYLGMETRMVCPEQGAVRCLLNVRSKADSRQCQNEVVHPRRSENTSSGRL